MSPEAIVKILSKFVDYLDPTSRQLVQEVPVDRQIQLWMEFSRKVQEFSADDFPYSAFCQNFISPCGQILIDDDGNREYLYLVKAVFRQNVLSEDVQSQLLQFFADNTPLETTQNMEALTRQFLASFCELQSKKKSWRKKRVPEQLTLEAVRVLMNLGRELLQNTQENNATKEDVITWVAECFSDLIHANMPSQLDIQAFKQTIKTILHNSYHLAPADYQQLFENLQAIKRKDKGKAIAPVSMSLRATGGNLAEGSSSGLPRSTPEWSVQAVVDKVQAMRVSVAEPKIQDMVRLIQAKDTEGLRTALESIHPEKVSKFINQSTLIGKRKLLHHAVLAQHPPLIELLRGFGASANVVDGASMTPLHYVARTRKYGKDFCSGTLYALSKCPQATEALSYEDNQGFTPREVAQEEHCVEEFDAVLGASSSSLRAHCRK